MVHLEEVHEVTGAGTAGGHDDDDEHRQLTVAVNGGSGKKKKKMLMKKEKHEVVPQLRFPPGFRFEPTDMELLEVFLRRKIDGRKLPLEVIFFDVPILNWEPHKLVEARKAYGVDRWYFFTKREPCLTNKEGDPRRKLNDVVGVSAGWKSSGKTEEFFRGPSGQLVGTRKLLVYYIGGEADKWTMHEYILADCKDQMDQFVLCTIQEKKYIDANCKRRKRISDGSKEPSTRKKKTAATTSQQPEQATEHEETSVYSDEHHLSLQEEHLMTPLPLLEHGQHHHQSLQEEHAMTLYEPITATHGTDLHEGYLDGDHHNYNVDVDTEEQTLAYNDGFFETPLMMMPQQHVYQASVEEMELQTTYGLNQSTILFNYQYASEHQLNNAMDPVVYANDNQGQQLTICDDYTSQISSQVVNTMECANCHDHHQLCQQPTAQGYYQKTGTLEDILGCPLRPGSLDTSPDTVFEGPEPLSYAAPGDDAEGDLSNDCFGDNLVDNNGCNDATMALLPDEEGNMGTNGGREWMMW
ncbi:NAC domain-containing protein 26-like [Brachypodium distachyon]|uniref:NAC domain-containing protein n=1 Tax=Brachypodium distachyon TaxID=15368 RepID=I1INU9_BRADI|nr:NAC domain-containing protein 26-like [Brachypodium distachyon]PNT64247.1 hypothetical protein BRADI_4g26600v3 [Brachypodium distachyon]|eukprot:XP_024318943.1 NAC domain-containing protein 26-like [Brachypodium distachyon]